MPSTFPQRRLPESRKASQGDAQPNRQRAILLAAEKLFALRGYHAVSIREIAAEAGVPLALVGYYYGAKQDLYYAIFESWQGTIDTRLAQLRAATQPPIADDALERLIASFIGPVVALHGSPEGQYYALMAARELALPTAESDKAQREFFDPLAHAYLDALQVLFPGSSRGQVAWCYQFMLGALLHFLSDTRVARLSKGENQPADPAATPHLLRFVTAGFRAVLVT
ncbi:TetR/AcrR family transcriptional regulator [Ideonella azotifigens]|nr:TetR/AcrR family transcriptional regulator [Ideonella azotifigens]MCD2341886.1 TetR/AcrR family transcriptional regulator [Ideonella azotifigens]